ncbi:hypothetical protein OY671_012388, partial [Metschnikowia pulcherrima]
MRSRAGVRWRWRSARRGDQVGPDHSARPPADPVRPRRAGAQPGRRDPLRRQVQPPRRARHHRGRRQGHHVEDGPFADQGQDARDRRAAGRRDERPHLLQGASVWLRRRHLRRRPAAGDPVRRAQSVGAAGEPAAVSRHSRNQAGNHPGRAV